MSRRRGSHHPRAPAREFSRTISTRNPHGRIAEGPRRFLRWVPGGSDGEFTALGVYGQNIYVDPKHRLVIVKNSVDPDFQKNGFENGQIALALWRAIAADLDANPLKPLR